MWTLFWYCWKALNKYDLIKVNWNLKNCKVWEILNLFDLKIQFNYKNGVGRKK